MNIKASKIKKVLNQISKALFFIVIIPFLSAPPLAAQPQFSNITDASFTVTWMTAHKTFGAVNYGTADALGSTAYDIRGQQTQGTTHYVQIVGLNPDTTYYFDISNSGIIDNNGGAHYACTTGPTLGIPSTDLAYGKVFLPGGSTPADGSLVYIIIIDSNGSGSPGQSSLLSSLVESGWWNVHLTGARELNMASYFSHSPSGDKLVIHVNAPDGSLADVTIDTAKDSPAQSIITQPFCEGDFDSDGDVDIFDLATFSSDFGRTNCCASHVQPCEGDFDSDCDVDIFDLGTFSSDFGRTNCP